MADEVETLKFTVWWDLHIKAWGRRRMQARTLRTLERVWGHGLAARDIRPLPKHRNVYWVEAFVDLYVVSIEQAVEFVREQVSRIAMNFDQPGSVNHEPSDDNDFEVVSYYWRGENQLILPEMISSGVMLLCYPQVIERIAREPRPLNEMWIDIADNITSSDTFKRRPVVVLPGARGP